MLHCNCVSAEQHVDNKLSRIRSFYFSILYVGLYEKSCFRNRQNKTKSNRPIKVMNFCIQWCEVLKLVIELWGWTCTFIFECNANYNAIHFFFKEFVYNQSEYLIYIYIFKQIYMWIELALSRKQATIKLKCIV